MDSLGSFDSLDSLDSLDDDELGPAGDPCEGLPSDLRFFDPGVLVDEEARVMALLHAVSSACPDLRERVPLSVALVKLVEFERMVLGLIDDLLSNWIPNVLSLMRIGVEMRGRVLESLPPETEAAVRGALEGPSPGYPEVLDAVEGLHRKRDPLRLGGLPLPLTISQARRLAARARARSGGTRRADIRDLVG
jgi:hypothetical protein